MKEPGPSIRHGTIDGYTNARCRCAECTGAHRQYNQRWRQKNPTYYRDLMRARRSERRAAAPPAAPAPAVVIELSLPASPPVEPAEIGRRKGSGRPVYSNAAQLSFMQLPDTMACHAVEALMAAPYLPSQYREQLKSRGDTPETDLMYAVFERAFADLSLGPGSGTGSAGTARRHRRYYESALAYFTDLDATGVFSVRALCELMGIDPAKAAKSAIARAAEGMRIPGYSSHVRAAMAVLNPAAAAP
jgi:hypothetical protein